MSLGRPTKYRPEFAEQAEKLCRLGATNLDLADFFNVTIGTIWQWRRHPAFLSSLKVAKDEADERVERSLYERAQGYSHPAVKIHVGPDGSVTEVPYIEHYPPDPTSMIFWLKNRKPENWRDRREEKIEGDVSIVVKGGLPKK